MVRCLATYAIDVALALALLKLKKMILLGGVVHSGKQFTVVTMRGKNQPARATEDGWHHLTGGHGTRVPFSDFAPAAGTNNR